MNGRGVKCDSCGQFTSRLTGVPCNPPTGGIDRCVCQRCAERSRPPEVPAVPDWYEWAAEEATWD